MESFADGRMPVGSAGQLLVMVVIVGMCIWCGNLCAMWAAVQDILIDTDNDSHNVSILSCARMLWLRASKSTGGHWVVRSCDAIFGERGQSYCVQRLSAMVSV